jgi:hypothetical protein
LLQKAVRAEVRREELPEETERYLADLRALAAHAEDVIILKV